MKNTSFFDALAVKKMTSDHFCLNLSERISWESFPIYVEQVLKMIEGRVEQKFDAVDIRLWQVKVCGCSLRFVFDDFPVMVSLESSSTEGDLLIEKLYHNFSAINEAP